MRLIDVIAQTKMDYICEGKILRIIQPKEKASDKWEKAMCYTPKGEGVPRYGAFLVDGLWQIADLTEYPEPNIKATANTTEEAEKIILELMGIKAGETT